MCFTTQCCCLCITNSTDLNNLNENTELLEKLGCCVPEMSEFLSNNNLPLLICTICGNQLENLYSFKEMCVRNHSVFASYVLELKNFGDIKKSEKNSAEIEQVYEEMLEKEISVVLKDELQDIKERRDSFEDNKAVRENLKFTTDEIVKDASRKSRRKQCDVKKIEANTTCEAKTNNFEDNLPVETQKIPEITLETILKEETTNFEEKMQFEHEFKTNKTGTKNMTNYVSRIEKWIEERLQPVEKNKYSLNNKEKFEESFEEKKRKILKRAHSPQILEESSDFEEMLLPLQPEFLEIEDKFEDNVIKMKQETYEKTNYEDKFEAIEENFDENFENRLQPPLAAIEALLKDSDFKTKKTKRATTPTAFIPDKYGFRCNICNKCFDYQSKLDRHIISHTGTKPYKCKICNARFSLKSSLTNHKIIHKGTRPYVCKICNRSFTHSGSLYNHTLTHNKDCICKICNKNCYRPSILKNHLLSHGIVK